MEIFSKTSRIFTLFLIILGISACGGGSSAPDESLLQSSLKAHVNTESKGVVEISDIKKTDGQLDADGMRYKMDYTVTITTLKRCLSRVKPLASLDKMYTTYSKLTDNSHRPSYCSKLPEGKTYKRHGMYYYSKGYTVNTKGLALFTKKESGWVLVSATVDLYYY